jgi:CheY-like chemotaxis protein
MSYGLLRKVLVVDDEPDIADLAVALLRAHAVDTAVAYSAHEALQILKADKEIDVVVSDVMMPGMTGLELADAVREMYPYIKIILVSGYTHASLLVGRERQYLFATKPYQITTILGMLRS